MSAAASLPFVSVIIPVYDDAERLARCLEQLERQTYPADRYEILVVDNGSEPPLGAEIEERRGVRLLREPCPGSYAARNAGIAAARGEILAFTDSDCLPAPDWIERGVAWLRANPTAGLVAGSIEVFARDPARPNAIELFQGVRAFPQAENLAERRYGPTANLFTFRRVVEAVGPFDARLKSGGDREWGERVHRTGQPLLLAPDVRVRHPARATYREQFLKAARVVGGQWERAYGCRRPPFRALLRDVAQDARATWSACRGLLGGDRDRPVPERVRLAWVTWCVGVFRAYERLRLYLQGGPRRR